MYTCIAFARKPLYPVCIRLALESHLLITGTVYLTYIPFPSFLWGGERPIILGAFGETKRTVALPI